MSHLGKAKSYKPKALNETMQPMRRQKSIIISHTPAEEHTNFYPNFNQREKMGKSKKREKTGGQLKKTK